MLQKAIRFILQMGVMLVGLLLLCTADAWCAGTIGLVSFFVRGSVLGYCEYHLVRLAFGRRRTRRVASAPAPRRAAAPGQPPLRAA